MRDLQPAYWGGSVLLIWKWIRWCNNMSLVFLIEWIGRTSSWELNLLKMLCRTAIGAIERFQHLDTFSNSTYHVYGLTEPQNRSQCGEESLNFENKISRIAVEPLTSSNRDRFETADENEFSCFCCSIIRFSSHTLVEEREKNNDPLQLNTTTTLRVF